MPSPRPSRAPYNEIDARLPGLNRPVLIVGAPRSGTEILANILKSYPGFAYAREPRILWKYGNDFRSDLLAERDTSRAITRHIRERFSTHVTRSGAVRLLEKTPANALRLPFVDAVLPECLIIHVLRSPLQAVPSTRRAWDNQMAGRGTSPVGGRLAMRLKETSPSQYPRYALEYMTLAFPPLRRRVAVWGPRLPGIAKVQREHGSFVAALYQWKTCVELAAAFGRSERFQGRYVEVSIDRLNTDQMGRLAAFCGIGDIAVVVEEFEKHFDRSAITDYKSELSPYERDLIQKLGTPLYDELIASLRIPDQ